KPRAKCVARSLSHIHRHCERSEAIHSAARGQMDCFAALAMTLSTKSRIKQRPEEPPMLTLHHLNDSRSQRILWLLEELGTPYEMKRYARDATTRLAPPELTKVHPLGKSPVITDRDVRIAESGAIVDYIIRRYG